MRKKGRERERESTSAGEVGIEGEKLKQTIPPCRMQNPMTWG